VLAAGLFHCSPAIQALGLPGRFLGAGHALFDGGWRRLFPGADPVFRGALAGLAPAACCCNAAFSHKTYIYQLDNK
jgi:hypothetical protein